MNANIVKIKLFCLTKYDLRGHCRSNKIAFFFNSPVSFNFLFVNNLILSKLYMNANIIE